MINVIIPIHRVDKRIRELFQTCVDSLKNQTNKDFAVTVVYSNSSIKDKVDEFVKGCEYGELNVTFLENTGNSDFASQINLAASTVKEEYISVVELDDEVSAMYVENVMKHINAYPEIDTFLPIVVDTDTKGEFIAFTNESVWAMNLTETIGYLDNESLKAYENYQTSGMVIKTETFNEIGGFKSNLVLSFSYEFLLRLTHNGKSVYVIPKLIYRHMNLRSGSLFWEYKNELSPEEAKFWMETAKKEYFFKEDREISYELQD
jgi:GT2 family glycosyltransferase